MGIADDPARILAGVNQWSVSFLERGDTHARLLASSGDGRRWKAVHDFGTDSIVLVVLAADAIVVALCREGVMRSADHGRTWVPLKPPHTSWEEQLGVSADGSLLLKTMDNIFAPGSGSFISTDGGAHWSRTGDIPGQDSLLVDPAGGLYAYERINFYVPPSTWGWGGQIHSSDDLGQTWHARGSLVDDPQP